MDSIRIRVRDKIASKISGPEYIVCDNSDYVIEFDFDSEWGGYSVKTARFIYGDGMKNHKDVVFSGSICNVPVVHDTVRVAIGVFAGDLHTTTPAIVPARHSTMSFGSYVQEPEEDIYNQIMEKIDEIDEKTRDMHGYYDDIKKIDDFIYSVEYSVLDESYAKKYFKENEEYPMPACSSVRSGNFYGRNYDWVYNNQAEFIINATATSTRYASVGVCGWFNYLTEQFVSSGEYSEYYKLLPFHTLDGINECGVVASINVVPNDKGVYPSEPLVSQKDEICVLMIVRYILDRFDSALSAVEYIRDYLRVFPARSIGTHEYEVHLMVADKDATYIVEFIEGHAEIIDVTDRPYMTNFYIHGVTPSEDGTVFTPADVVYGNLPSSQGITYKGAGLERFNILARGFSSVEDESDMRSLMNSVYYTKAYTELEWLSEFVEFGDLTVDSPPEDFEYVLTLAQRYYEDRSRDTGHTWQTVHSSVYDIEKRAVYITAQEGDEEYVARVHTPLESYFGTENAGKFLTVDDGGNIALDKSVDDYYTKDEVDSEIESYHDPSKADSSDLDEYAKTSYVDDEISAVEEMIPSLDGYAMESYVQNYHDSSKADVSSLSEVATSGDYDDLLNKPYIPSEITEQTVSDWGFTKNTGTYIKPNTGIPLSDLSSSIQTSIGLADSAMQQDDIDSAVAPLQEQIDAIVSKSDVVDVVATYADLRSYDTSGLLDNDIVKVLDDVTHGNARSYYRWTGSDWSYVGSENIGYTKSETDTLLSAKQNTIDDLSDIRRGATLGDTAYQKPYAGIPDEDLEQNYYLASNPNGYTDDTVANSKYSKPSGGIPKTDMSSSVQESLDKADSAVQPVEGKDLFSGDYNDLTNKPDIPSLEGYATEEYVQNHHDTTKANIDDLASVATSGQYDDLSGTPLFVEDASGNIYKIDDDFISAFYDSDGNSITSTYATKSELSYKYTKPAGGIPKTDLVSSVQSSLNKADTAIQSLSGYATESYVRRYHDPTKADVEDLESINTRVSSIESEIPAQASSSNQLADKDFVNSSISTNTANYISNNGQPFNSPSQLYNYTGTVTNNDYAFVTGTDASGNVYFDRYKASVSGSTVSWAKEYRLNNSSFTADQWAAINSGIASGDVSLIRTALQPSAISDMATRTWSDDRYIQQTMTVTATELGRGQTPTVSYDADDNELSFGIPKGNTGVYVGSGTMPEDCNVQIDELGDVLEIVQTTGTSTTDVMSQKAVTDTLRQSLATKQDTLTAGENITIVNNVISASGGGGGGGSTSWNEIIGKPSNLYLLPTGGVPKTDLASSVQTSLGKADTALQTHQDITGKENSSNKRTSWSSSTGSDTYYPSEKLVKTSLDGKADSSHTHTKSQITDFPTIPSAPGTLITNAATAQTVSSGESLSGSIKLHKVSKTGSYNDLLNKPTIPSAVTESTVSGWGFTKNTGTYSKPTDGIPKTDLSSSVQSSIDKADSALQSLPSHNHDDRYYTETETNNIISNLETTGNKVTSISESSTDTQYPTAKAAYSSIKSLSDRVVDMDNNVRVAPEILGQIAVPSGQICQGMTTDGTYLYLATVDQSDGVSNPKIHRVNPSTMAVTKKSPPKSGHYNNLNYFNGYIYCTGFGPSEDQDDYSQIYKYNFSTNTGTLITTREWYWNFAIGTSEKGTDFYIGSDASRNSFNLYTEVTPGTGRFYPFTRCPIEYFNGAEQGAAIFKNQFLCTVLTDPRTWNPSNMHGVQELYVTNLAGSTVKRINLDCAYYEELEDVCFIGNKCYINSANGRIYTINDVTKLFRGYYGTQHPIGFQKPCWLYINENGTEIYLTGTYGGQSGRVLKQFKLLPLVEPQVAENAIGIFSYRGQHFPIKVNPSSGNIDIAINALVDNYEYNIHMMYTRSSDATNYIYTLTAISGGWRNQSGALTTFNALTDAEIQQVCNSIFYSGTSFVHHIISDPTCMYGWEAEEF